MTISPMSLLLPLAAVLLVAGATPADAWPPDPCEVLADDLLTSVFDIPSDTKLVRLASERAPQPVCTVRWVKRNLAELQQRHAQRMQDHAKSLAAGRDKTGGHPKPPRIETHNEVVLTLVKERFAGATEADRQFDRAVDVLAGGITTDAGAAAGAREVTFQAVVERDVADVGDEAAWMPGLNQLSVRSGGVIFHVRVKVDDHEAVNRDRAIALARLLADELGPG